MRDMITRFDKSIFISVSLATQFFVRISAPLYSLSKFLYGSYLCGLSHKCYFYAYGKLQFGKSYVRKVYRVFCTFLSLRWSLSLMWE